MKYHLIPILALILFSTLSAEPDHKLRAFLGITSITSKIKADTEARFFEITVFREGQEVARLPTSGAFDRKDHREFEVSLMFDEKQIVKFIGEGSTTDLSERFDWSKVLKPSGGKFFRKGTSDKPIGMFEGSKVVSTTRIGTRHSGSGRFKTNPNIKMDDSVKIAIENAESCILVVLKAGPKKKIERELLESIEAEIERPNDSTKKAGPTSE